MLAIRLNGAREVAAKWRGEAMRLLSNLKRRMQLGNLSQGSDMRTETNGTVITVQSGFDRDVVEITGHAVAPVAPLEYAIPPTLIVFLVRSSVEYMAWRLPSMRPDMIKMENYTTQISPYTYIHPSTVQSRPDYNLHTYVVETRAGCWGTTTYLYYGNYVEICPYLTTLQGLTGCYQPPEFNLGIKIDDYIFTGNFPESLYDLCSSRQPFQIYNDQVIKNLKITYHSGTGVLAVEYDNESGHQVETKDWTHLIEGVLNPNKFIGRSNYYEVIPWHYIGNCYEVGYGYWFKFGDVNLVLQGGYTLSCGGDSPFWVEWTDANAHLMDYDCLDCDDKTFICFYSSGHTSYSRFWSYSGVNGQTLNFNLAYQVNGKGLVQEILGYLFQGYNNDEGSFTYGFGGTRIGKISCKAHNSYLVYTYTKYTYIGPSNEEHFYDDNDTYYQFIGRFLGIISVKSGVRKEIEITEKMAAVFPTTFDITNAAAIGIHELMEV